MNTLEFEKADTKEKIKQLADTADEIWHEYFTCILSESQIDYMVDKYQSEKAVTEQIANKNYSYFLVRLGEILIGYVGISPEEETKRLFLSKFYLKKNARPGICLADVQLYIRYCQKSWIDKRLSDREQTQRPLYSGL